jgi:hypothetical protein
LISVRFSNVFGAPVARRPTPDDSSFPIRRFLGFHKIKGASKISFMPRAPFPPRVLAEFAATKYLYIRSGDHRFIPIWVVVVDKRVIVRSWNDNPDGWYRAFQSHPLGDVKFETRTVPVRAIALRSKRLNDAADEAYAAKYTTKPNAKYVKGLASTSRKLTSLELIPV